MKIIFSFKFKLILAITVLMAVVFSSLAFLFINEKKIEMASDIYKGVQSFAELTASSVVSDVGLYLNEGGFVYFNRSVRELMNENLNVSYVKVVSFKGEVVYDSSVDIEKRYTGGARVVDERLLAQVKAQNASVVVGEEGEVFDKLFYLKKKDWEYLYVDENEYLLTAPKDGFRVLYFVQPANERYSVVYGVTYEGLEKRVADMQFRIIEVALFGFLLGVFLALFMGARVSKPVEKLVVGVAEVAKGNFDARVEIHSRDEFEYLGESFNQMAADLGASLEARVYKERVGKELELARAVQRTIIPAVLPEVSGLDIAAGLLPAEEVGGDAYDVIVDRNGEAMIYLGDVTGHGVPASMLSAVANSVIYSHSVGSDIVSIISNLNAVLHKKSVKTMFMTLCLAKWNSVNGVLSYVNAGHDPILKFTSGDGSVIEGLSGGLAVGMLAEIADRVKVGEMGLVTGDVAVLISDGIVECWKSEKENYGMAKLKEFIGVYCKANPSATALQIKDAILKDVADFAAGYKQADDITIVVMKRG